MKSNKHQPKNEIWRSTLDFIRKSQSADGHFESVSIDARSGDQSVSHTIFHTALILNCLASLNCPASHRDSSAALSIAKKSIAFLTREKRAGFIWNYWKKGTGKFPPPDWDDTSCAIAAISQFAPELMTGDRLRSMTESLILAEIETGGPYSTWIVPAQMKDQWLDKDIVVNSNIGYMLSRHDISLPSLIAFADKCIENNEFPSKYYSSPIVCLYFISRAYKGTLHDKAIRLILSRRLASGLWKNDLETALAVSALINFGIKEKDMEILAKPIRCLQSISKARSWKCHPLYTEEHHGSAMLSGSTPLTAAFCLEALALFDRYLASNITKAIAKEKAEIESAIQQEIILETMQSFDSLPSMKKRMQFYIEYVTKKDPGNQITMLPYQFYLAIQSKLSKESKQTKRPEQPRRPSIQKTDNKSTRKLLIRLGSANLLGWIAYRIYDDILDNEGQPEDLPLANAALRTLTAIFGNISLGLPTQNAEEIFHSIMNDVDQANEWERDTCFKHAVDGHISLAELPDYKKYDCLANKSMGHILGPLFILMKSGSQATNGRTAMDLTRDFFRHYIIARQLNDDAHDWLSDLEKGFLNSSSIFVLNEYKRKTKRSSLELKMDRKTREYLQSIFWNISIIPISKLIFDHIKKARKSLTANPALFDTAYLESLLLPIERATESAITNRKQMLQFLGRGKKTKA